MASVRYTGELFLSASMKTKSKLPSKVTIVSSACPVRISTCDETLALRMLSRATSAKAGLNSQLMSFPSAGRDLASHMLL